MVGNWWMFVLPQRQRRPWRVPPVGCPFEAGG